MWPTMINEVGCLVRDIRVCLFVYLFVCLLLLERAPPPPGGGGVCTCVCVSERERVRHGQADGQTGRQESGLSVRQ